MRPGREPPAAGLAGILMGWAADDCRAALACFRLSADSIVGEAPALRPARPPFPGLREACLAALDLPAGLSDAEARAFFATHFEPVPIPADAFFTGYYEPIVEGARFPSDAFAAPLLGVRRTCTPLPPTSPAPIGPRHWRGAARAARRSRPLPDRRAIEADLDAYRPVVWLRDWVEAFLIQVQGSARVRLPDGTMLRLTYAGRNGHPYTSIGRILIERGEIPLAEMTLDRLKGWLRANGQAPGEAGRALMQRNASFIFFEAVPAVDETGPTGGAGVPLTALRSIAVDRALWCYGLPFWVDVTIPLDGGAPRPFRRLMIAQDTGSAIVGPARVDIFLGSGAAAGRSAGDIRHRGTLAVLRPRPPAGAGA